jgi:hypothetical protein
MRFHVHGTDMASGQRRVLVTDQVEASAAVRAAMAKGIVVSHVTEGPRFRFYGFAVATAISAAAVLAGTTWLFHWREQDAKSQLAAAMAEESRLATALTESGGMVTALQRRAAALEEAHGGAARQLVDQLEGARQRVAVLDQQLTAAQERVSQLEKKAAAGDKATSSLKLQLAAAQVQASQLKGQLEEERLRIKDLEGMRAMTSKLEKRNEELSSTVELLKGQLLEQAAKASAAPVVQASDLPPPPAVEHPRWAIKASYDRAADFLALHFVKDGVAVALGDGAFLSSGVAPASAAAMKLMHDGDRRQVYSVVLSVSLAADAPKERLTHNRQLLMDFLGRFAPGLKEPDAFVADSIRQLAGKDGGQRLVRVGDDYKLTVWNNRLGLYTWKIESPRGEIED